MAKLGKRRNFHHKIDNSVKEDIYSLVDRRIKDKTLIKSPKLEFLDSMEVSAIIFTKIWDAGTSKNQSQQ